MVWWTNKTTISGSTMDTFCFCTVENSIKKFQNSCKEKFNIQLLSNQVSISLIFSEGAAASKCKIIIWRPCHSVKPVSANIRPWFWGLNFEAEFFGLYWSSDEYFCIYFAKSNEKTKCRIVHENLNCIKFSPKLYLYIFCNSRLVISKFEENQIWLSAKTFIAPNFWRKYFLPTPPACFLWRDVPNFNFLELHKQE